MSCCTDLDCNEDEEEEEMETFVTRTALSPLSVALGNLRERGERLSKLRVEAVHMNEGAQMYRSLTKQHLLEMQKKSSRLG